MIGNKERARELLEIYEKESGYFDDSHHIERGRETFYKLKGKCYMAYGMYDSAEVCFRKELNDGSNFIDQGMASNELARLYQKLGQPDSAAKYALYAYAMNDSVYAQMATAEVERAHSLYNYTYHERQAQKEHLQAEKEKTYSRMLAVILVIIVLSSALVLWQQYKRRKANLWHYLAIKHALDSAKVELAQLRAYEEKYKSLKQNAFGHIVLKKEEEIARLKAEIQLFQKEGKSSQNKNEAISAAYREFVCRVREAKRLDDKE